MTQLYFDREAVWLCGVQNEMTASGAGYQCYNTPTKKKHLHGIVVEIAVKIANMSSHGNYGYFSF